MTGHTEATMLALLERRYRETKGNGPAWAFIPHVRNAAGFDATRTLDAVAMGLWPSRGLELHGHEIKVSRADWLREMRNPAKAEAGARLVDRWWLVISDPSIVQEGELPPTWGLMVAGKRGLVVRKQAPQLPATDAPWMPRSFLAALLRASVRDVQPAEVAAAVQEARAQEKALHQDALERWRKERDEARNRIRAFEAASGVSLAGWQGTHDAEAVGAALRLVLKGEAETERLTRRLLSLADQANAMADGIHRMLGKEG